MAVLLPIIIQGWDDDDDADNKNHADVDQENDNHNDNNYDNLSYAVKMTIITTLKQTLLLRIMKVIILPMIAITIITRRVVKTRNVDIALIIIMITTVAIDSLMLVPRAKGVPRARDASGLALQRLRLVGLRPVLEAGDLHADLGSEAP